MAPGSRDGARMASRKGSRVATATTKMNAPECLGSDHRQGANGYASLQVRLVRPSFFCTSLHPSTTCLYVCLFVCQSFIRHHFIILPSVYPFIHPFIHPLSIHPSIPPSFNYHESFITYLSSIHPTLHPSTNSSICSPTHLSIFHPSFIMQSSLCSPTRPSSFIHPSSFC